MTDQNQNPDQNPENPDTNTPANENVVEVPDTPGDQTDPSNDDPDNGDGNENDPSTA